VAVVGAGPVGLSAIACARLFSPSHVVAIDQSDARLKKAREFGADVTVNDATDDPAEIIRDLTDGYGADVAIEAVGTAATFELAVRLVRPGGRVANVGVHGKPALLHLESLWARDITVTMGLVDAWSTPTLMRLVDGHQIDASRFITHRFSLDNFEQAYAVFGDAADNGALKVVLTREEEADE
jgi:alcohol dehydrogenase